MHACTCLRPGLSLQASTLMLCRYCSRIRSGQQLSLSDHRVGSLILSWDILSHMYCVIDRGLKAEVAVARAVGTLKPSCCQTLGVHWMHPSTRQHDISTCVTHVRLPSSGTVMAAHPARATNCVNSLPAAFLHLTTNQHRSLPPLPLHNTNSNTMCWHYHTPRCCSTQDCCA